MKCARVGWTSRGGVVVLLSLATVVVCACRSGTGWVGGGGGGPIDTEAMALLLPTRIKIHSFTKVKPLYGSPLPNGIEVWIEPLDRFGDVVKVVGEFHFELYSRKPASGDPKGEQIEFWQVRIGTAKEQQTYWDRVARMYQFPLGWDFAPPPGKKYVLAATYHAPSGERLEDEFEIKFEFDRDQLMDALSKPDQ
jgi:hypothetical protein